MSGSLHLLLDKRSRLHTFFLYINHNSLQKPGDAVRTMKHRILVRATAVLLTLFGCLCVTGCGDEVSYDFFSTIRGAVYDASTGEPLPNAAVTLMPSSRTLQTGGDGTFAFEELDPGQYTLSVQKEGYYVDRKSVTAISGETVQTDILLRKI